MFGAQVSTMGAAQPMQRSKKRTIFEDLIGSVQPQQASGSFGMQQTGFGMGQQQTSFGQQQARPFGQQSTFGQSAGQSMFGQPSTTSSLGQSQPSAFGQPQPSAFGQPQQSVFGQPQQQPSAFGQSTFGQSTFGQQQHAPPSEPIIIESNAAKCINAALNRTIKINALSSDFSADNQSVVSRLDKLRSEVNSLEKILDGGSPVKRAKLDIQMFQSPQVRSSVNAFKSRTRLTHAPTSSINFLAGAVFANRRELDDISAFNPLQQQKQSIAHLTVDDRHSERLEQMAASSQARASFADSSAGAGGVRGDADANASVNANAGARVRPLGASSASLANEHAPVLTKPGYTTLPPLEKLRIMPTEGLRAVENFEVIHESNGSILWPGLTDVTGVDLNRVVDIQDGSFDVYSQGPVDEPGTKLNKPAIITLRNIFPTNDDGDRVADLRGIEAYALLIRQTTQDYGATLLDYDSAMGVWRFKVNNFCYHCLCTHGEAPAGPGRFRPESVPADTAAADPGSQAQV